MTTTPLPRWKFERVIDGIPCVPTVEAEQARADLEAEVKRLNTAIQWEQNRAERIGTHGPGCEKWGPAHYECALRALAARAAPVAQQATVPEGYALIGIDALKAWGVYDQVRDACQYPVDQQAEAAPPVCPTCDDVGFCIKPSECAPRIAADMVIKHVASDDSEGGLT